MIVREPLASAVSLACPLSVSPPSLSALAAWGRWPGLQSQGVRSPGRSCSSSHSSVGSQPGVCVWRRIVFRDVVKLQVRQKPGLVSASHLPLRWHMLPSFPSELDTRMPSFPSSLVHPFPSFPPWCVQKRLPLPLPDVKRSLLDHSAQPQEGQERIAEESSTYGRVNEGEGENWLWSRGFPIKRTACAYGGTRSYSTYYI